MTDEPKVRLAPDDEPYEDWPAEYAYHNSEVQTNEDGSADVHVVTNDDNDDGYPDGKVEQWELHFPTEEAALKHTGKSRVGVSGVRVNVYLNGQRI